MRPLSPSSLFMRTCTLILLASACSAALASKVYQWKDAKGVTHYSDSPPPGDQYQDRRIDDRGAPALAASPAGKSVENPQCTTAKRNLDLLSGKTSLQMDTDNDGKPDKVLDDSSRKAQRGVAEAAIAAYCNPAPAPVPVKAGG